MIIGFISNQLLNIEKAFQKESTLSCLDRWQQTSLPLHYHSRLSFKKLQSLRTPISAINQNVDRLKLIEELDASSSLSRLLELCPESHQGFSISKSHTAQGVRTMINVLTKNIDLLAAPNNDKDRTQAYRDILVCLGYIGYRCEKLYAEKQLSEDALIQLLDIIGSAGQNCFSAYKECIRLISSEFSDVLGLNQSIPRHIKDQLESNLDSVYLKAMNTVADKLFMPFFDEFSNHKNKSDSWREAMRVHYRHHFFQTLTNHFIFQNLSITLKIHVLLRLQY